MTENELANFEFVLRSAVIASRTESYCDLENLPPEFVNPEIVAIKRDIVAKAGEEVRLILSLLANDPAELLEIGRLKLVNRNEWRISKSRIQKYLRRKMHIPCRKVPKVMFELRDVLCQLINI